MTESPESFRFIRREEFEDGTVNDTSFVEVSGPSTTDPLVRTRLAPEGGGESSEVITEFAASPTRPVSYPPTLPFIPNRTVWTTESPNGRNLEGARWPAADAEEVLSNVVEASIAQGWVVIPRPSSAKLLGTPDVVLQSGNYYRELQVVRMDDSALLQLWDVPVTLFDQRPATQE
ncbi:MAG TPA: hypothetical protein VK912_01730 [Longimicrobiales bacterium]|nr:hypothetical protein [Longimicrobiales bacterium]